MAARRLLIVMLVLLGVSTLAAALVGNRPLGEEGTDSTIAGETETETIPTDTVPEGPLLKPLAIDVGGKVQVIPLEVGEQLTLIVRSKRTDQLEIPALGLLEPVAPNAPARFDILAERPANYGMRFVQANRVVARIEITKPARKRSASQGV
jgi:hypothetical protein